MLRARVMGVLGKIFNCNFITIYSVVIGVCLCLLSLYAIFKTIHKAECDNVKGVLETKICDVLAVIFTIALYISFCVTIGVVSSLVILHRVMNKKRTHEYECEELRNDLRGDTLG